MATWQNIGGTWKSGTWWQNVAGTWKSCNVWKNVAGTWKNLSTFFTPDGGAVSDSQPGYCAVTLYCSTPAQWTYSGGGTRGTVSVANGGTASSITFTVTAQPLGSTGNTSTVQRTWNVTGVSNGVTRTFTVTVEAQGETNGGTQPIN